MSDDEPVPEVVGTALKALAQGEASSQQQKIVLYYIINQLAGVDQRDFAKPGSAEMMAWKNGRRFVGIELRRIITTPMGEGA